jgi:hypothetical protein
MSAEQEGLNTTPTAALHEVGGTKWCDRHAGIIEDGETRCDRYIPMLHLDDCQGEPLYRLVRV